MRPVAYSRNVAVFHGIEVDVIDVIAQIAFVADQMLPVAALPDATFVVPASRWRHPLTAGDAPRKPGLDQHPACREVGISRWQRPHRMQMIRQHAPRNARERMHRTHRIRTLA